MKIPQQPPDFRELLVEMNPDQIRRLFSEDIRPSPNGKYLHWDELRHRPLPDGLSHKEWWLGIKLARINMAHQLPLNDAEGESFTYSMPDPVLERVHRIDQLASGRIEISELVTNPSTRDRYVVNSLIEEAITSSQLEGASTSHRVAKEMIKSRRRPRDKSEQMILNNYYAMEFVREHQRDELTPALICELHRIVTDKTLDDPRDAGRLQEPGEARVKVWDRMRTGQILHEPPPAEQLPERLDALCKFANGETPDGFLHPVVRAIIVHFWLAYDHPFVDGNGRTARALFYWAMLRQGYWLASFLSISSILTKAYAKYPRSFLHVETDGRDTTYFIIYQLKVIMRAIEQLHQYLRRKMAEVKKVERLVKTSGQFNHRQVALIGHALRHPDAFYTVESHRSSHNVSTQTARTDLTKLADHGILARGMLGKAYYFFPPDDIVQTLRDA